MRLGTWTHGDAGRAGSEAEIHARREKHKHVTLSTDGLNRDIPLRHSPLPLLQEFQLARSPRLHPSPFPCRAEEHLEAVRNFMRKKKAGKSS